MRKLIIGSSGFIGSNLIYNSIHKTICGYNSKKNIIKKKNVRAVKLDIFNRNSLIKKLDKYKINEIINLVSDNNNIINENTNNYSIWVKNTLSLVRLLEIVREKKNIKIIHISSNEPQNKNSTIYTLSKRSSESICKVYRDNFNIKVSIIRLGNIFGIADRNKKRIVPYIINQIINREKINLQNPKKKIEFCFADDVSKYILNFKDYSKQLHLIKPKFTTSPEKLAKTFQLFLKKNYKPRKNVEKKLYKIFIWYMKNKNILKIR